MVLAQPASPGLCLLAGPYGLWVQELDPALLAALAARVPATRQLGTRSPAGAARADALSCLLGGESASLGALEQVLRKDLGRLSGLLATHSNLGAADGAKAAALAAGQARTAGSNAGRSRRPESEMACLSLDSAWLRRAGLLCVCSDQLGAVTGRMR